MSKVVQFITSPLSIIDKKLGKAVQAVGLIVLGAATGNYALIAAGIQSGASLFAKGPKVNSALTDRLTASVDPRAFRKTVLGQTAMPVDVRYEEWSGTDQEYCDWIVLHASHAIDGLEEIWFDTEMAWSQTTGVIGKYAGYFSVPHVILEGTPANAFSFGAGKWNTSARLTGCAYSHWRFKTTGNSKKATSPFSSGLPSRITVIGRGAKLYDPRRDSTVPGGNGSMRADDQSTWRFTASDGAVIGENLALHVLRVVLGWRIRNPVTGEMRLATGSGVPVKRLNLASFIVAANLADEAVNRSAGGTEPRYHGACVLSEGDDPKGSLDMLCAGCCGRFRDTAGKLSFSIAHNDLAAAATDEGLLDDDVIGGFTWDPDAALEATPNVVRGKYVDATTNSLYQMIDYPEVRLPSPDGQDRIFPLDLGVVESPSQAQRLAKQALQRKQYPREFSAQFDERAWKYTVGDVVPFTFAPLSFNRRLFRVKEQDLAQAGGCQMTLTVEVPAIYAWDADDVAPVQPAEAIVYDSRNNPLILAIEDLDAQISLIFSDGVITHGREKRETLRQWQALESQFYALDQRYGDLGSPTDVKPARDDAATATGALSAYLASLTPAWDDVAVDTPVDSVTIASRWDLAREKVETFAAAVTGRPGKDGTSALVGYLTNESHQLTADAAGNVTSYAGAGGAFKVLFGLMDVTADCAFAIAATSYNGGEFVAPIAGDGRYACSALNPPLDEAWVDYSATYQGQAVTRRFSLTKVRPGADGRSPALLALSSTHQTFAYDTNGNTLGQTTTITATPTNSNDGVQWRVLAANTYPLSEWVDSPTLAAQGFATRHLDYLNIQIESATFAQLLASRGTTGLIYQVRFGNTPTIIRDQISIVKVQDGAKGARGERGDSAPLVRTQWSIDGSTNWHDTYFGADVYYRQSNDNGATFGPAIRGVGEGGSTGADGLSPSSIFIRSATVPATPGTSTGNPPPSWSDGPPAGTDFLWLSTAKFRGATQVTGWSAPQRISGDPGQAGADGYAVSLSAYVALVSLASNGAVKNNALPLNFVVQVLKGNADVTGQCAFTFAASDALTITSNGASFALTGAGANGTIDVGVSIGGVALQAQRVKVTVVRDNAPPSGTTISSGPLDAGIGTSTYDEANASYRSIVLQATNSGKIGFEAVGQYYSAASSGRNSAITLNGKAQMRVVGTSAWSDVTGEVPGTQARYRPQDGPDPGEVSITVNVTGLTAGSNYEFRTIYRITQQTNSAGGTGIQGGTMSAGVIA